MSPSGAASLSANASVAKQDRDAPSVEHVVVLRRVKDQPVEIYRELERVYVSCLPAEDGVRARKNGRRRPPVLPVHERGRPGTPKGFVMPAAGTWSEPPYHQIRVDIKDRDVYCVPRTPAGSPGTVCRCTGRYARCPPIVMTENTPNYPDPQIWKISRLRSPDSYCPERVSGWFMKLAWNGRTNKSCTFRILGSVGEPINPRRSSGSISLRKEALPDRRFLGQTETGMHMVSTWLGEQMRQGFAGIPLPGVVAEVVTMTGSGPAEKGVHGHYGAVPSMMRSVQQRRAVPPSTV
jgi:acetyl-CoA synthetase